MPETEVKEETDSFQIWSSRNRIFVDLTVDSDEERDDNQWSDRDGKNEIHHHGGYRDSDSDGDGVPINGHMAFDEQPSVMIHKEHNQAARLSDDKVNLQDINIATWETPLQSIATRDSSADIDEEHKEREESKPISPADQVADT